MERRCAIFEILEEEEECECERGNSFEDTLELVKPAEKFDGFENQVISENQ